MKKIQHGAVELLNQTTETRYCVARGDDLFVYEVFRQHNPDDILGPTIREVRCTTNFANRKNFGTLELAQEIANHIGKEASIYAVTDATVKTRQIEKVGVGVPLSETFN